MSFIINNNTTWQEFEKNLAAESLSAFQYIFHADAPRRSLWSRVTGKSHSLDKIVELAKQKIYDHLQHHWNVKYCKTKEYLAIDIIFNHVLMECQVSHNSLRTISAAQKVFAKIAHPLVAVAGSIVPLYEDGLTFQTKSTHHTDAHNVLKLLMGAPFSRYVISSELVNAVLFKKDEQRLDVLKEELQLIGQRICRHLETISISPAQEKLCEILIGNILSLYPFVEPNSNSILTIPQKVEGKWMLVEYNLEIIPMTSSLFGSPIPAVGLKPSSNKKAHPLLLFRGTPQPTANGALLAMASDVVPGYSVGEFLYEHSAKGLVQSWIEQAHKEFRGVKLYGQSLGGSLSLISLSRQPDKISEVNVYGSPGLLNNSLALFEERSKNLREKPQVNIYWNHGDVIPLIGGFHRDWNLFKLIIPETQGRFPAHAAMNAARKKVIVIKTDVELDAHSITRKVMTVFHQFISLLCLPLTISLTCALFVITLFKKKLGMR